MDERVADLPEADWARPTPAQGWTIAHQIAHLSWTDEIALLAVTDPAAFATVLRLDATRALVSPASIGQTRQRP